MQSNAPKNSNLFCSLPFSLFVLRTQRNKSTAFG